MCAVNCMMNCTSEIKTKVIVLCIECFQIVGGTGFLERSQASSVCPCGKSNMQMKKRMEQWSNDTDRGN